MLTRTRHAIWTTAAATRNIGAGLTPQQRHTSPAKGHAMERFLIEVPHEPEDCALAIKIFMESGSHFMTHADYGCEDGEHKAWMIVELDDKAAARAVLPPAYRAQAKIVKLITPTFKDLQDAIKDPDETIKRHFNG